MSIKQIMQAIGAVSEKVNDYTRRLSDYTTMRADNNEQSAADAQNASIELDEVIDSRISDIENALCELSEQEEEING